MNRLKNIEKTISQDPVKYLLLDQLIPSQYKKLLLQVEDFGKIHLTTQRLYDCHEQAIFPDYLIPHLQQLGVGKYFIPQPYGIEAPLLVQGLIVASIAQFDLGVSTFLFLQLPLAGRTVFTLGSEEQKQRYLKDIVELKKIWGWALTEREVGSNSTRLSTNYVLDDPFLKLNGNKRWIGNGNNDYLIVYGNFKEGEQKKNIIGAIVDMQSKGVTSNPIQNKYSFRIVQNCQIEFENVILPKQNILPGAKNYKLGVQDVLKHSRIIVIWNAVGGCIGVYKNVIRYALQRKQFGRSIAGFQLIQQKIVRIMANLQAILLATWRITELYQQDKNFAINKISMFKAWVTERARLICQLGRQILGGNGLLQENYVMKAMLDMEVLYTYQGTYEMNSLLAGSELTGLKAFT